MAGRTQLWTTVALGLALLPGTGCLFRSRPVPKRTTIAAARSATLQELVNALNQQAAAIKTLNATVDINTSVGGSRKGKVTDYQQIRGYILVRKPEMLRMIGLLPIVRNRAFDMVSDANGFRLYIVPKNRFIVGPPDVTHASDNALENLRPQVIYDALLLRPVDPQNEIAVLEKSAEVVTDARSKNQTESPTYVMDVIHRGETGWYLSRKVIFSRTDLLAHRQLIYDKTGSMVTEATYEAYKEFEGVQFPSDIDIWRPQEEYSIGITVLKLVVNQPLTDEQFALAQPAGSQLVRLDANNRSTPGGDGDKPQ
jgi:hypothetical protein